MQGSNLGFRPGRAFYLLTTGIKGTSSMKLHRDLGITQKSAWHLASSTGFGKRGRTTPCLSPVQSKSRNVHGGQREEQARQQEDQGRARDARQDGGGWHEKELYTGPNQHFRLGLIGEPTARRMSGFVRDPCEHPGHEGLHAS